MGLIQKIDPQLIHIHGTEREYGLVTKNIHIPSLITVQGLMTAYLINYWGTLPPEKCAQFKELNYRYRDMNKRARIERRIFRENAYFTGRTEWDKVWTHVLNPQGNYYDDGARILRDDFYNKHWSIDKICRHTVYTTVTLQPYKGLEVLLYALRYLIEQIPDIRLRLAGNISNRGYGKYIRELINDLELAKHVTVLGFLRSDVIAAELSSSHVYVLPSMSENSPNSLAEAQMIGTPCVASYVGGVPSMVEDGKTGLLFPKGDPAMLADAVKRIFEDNELACSLSMNERKMALERHDPEKITTILMDIYTQVLTQQQDHG